MIQEWRIPNRHVIARWNPLSIANSLGELSSTKHSDIKVDSTQSHNDARLRWNLDKNIFTAIDFVSSAFLHGDMSEVQDARSLIQKSVNERIDIPILVRKLLVVDEEDSLFSQPYGQRAEIAKMKKHLIKYPRDCVRWAELAWHYLLQGQLNRAERALLVAYGLNPNNRYIIRSITRLYVHLKELDKALRYASISDVVEFDPWTISNQIAVSNILGRPSKFIKSGRILLEDNSNNPRSLSELASELGTMDFASGNIKRGKRKFVKACESPHENALAQIFWISSKDTQTEQKEFEPIGVPYNYEAKVYSLLSEEPDWNNIFINVKEWAKYQPFSKTPIMLGSSIAASLLDDYTSALDILRIGHEINKNDPFIINNYVYTYALMGDEAKAKEKLALIDIASLRGQEQIIFKATRGLIEYRFGNAELGRSLYFKAAELAKKSGDMYLYYSALIHLAREEKRQGNRIDSLLAEVGKDDKYTRAVFLNSYMKKFELCL